MWTIVRPRETCGSVCAFIWLGGAKRGMGAGSHIGFHGAFDTNTNRQDVMSNTMLGALLANMGFSYDDIFWMLSPQPLATEWLTPEKAEQHHIAYVSLDEAELPPPIVEKPRPTGPATTLRVTLNMNLRAGPGITFPNVLSPWAPQDYVPQGKTFTWPGAPGCINGTDGRQWCQVNYKHHNTETVGWLSERYLEIVR